MVYFFLAQKNEHGKKESDHFIPVPKVNRNDPLNLMSAESCSGSQEKCDGSSQETDNSQKVAKHYNELQEAGKEVRQDSRIYFMRNFNNWIKSVLIGETLKLVKSEMKPGQPVTVLDMCSGKGGDFLKWKKGGVSRVVCADIAGTSVEQSEARYNDLVERSKHDRYQQVFDAEFITADCSRTRLKDCYKDPNIKFEITSCQFSFHYCFESFQQAERMLQNAVECVSLGGYFMGTTPNSQELVRRLRESKDLSFGNEVYRVTFESEDKQNLPLFGARYNFHLEGVVDCPEFLVFFPVLEKMAEKYGMKLVFKKTFADYFNENSTDRDHKSLLSRMSALETFPPSRDTQLMGGEDQYEHARAFLDHLKRSETPEEAQRRRYPITIGTLSKSEWEAITLYLVFMFQKVKDIDTGKEWQSQQTTQETRKRPAESSASGTEPPKVVKYS